MYKISLFCIWGNKLSNHFFRGSGVYFGDKFLGHKTTNLLLLSFKSIYANHVCLDLVKTKAPSYSV